MLSGSLRNESRGRCRKKAAVMSRLAVDVRRTQKRTSRQREGFERLQKLRCLRRLVAEVLEAQS